MIFRGLCYRFYLLTPKDDHVEWQIIHAYPSWYFLALYQLFSDHKAIESKDRLYNFISPFISSVCLSNLNVILQRKPQVTQISEEFFLLFLLKGEF